jgi:membrane protein YdbS with pleckstrin-like domain
MSTTESPAPQRLDARIRTVWLLGQALPIAVLGVIGGLAIAATGIPPLGLLVAVACLALAAGVAVFVDARFRRWSWWMTAESLELRHGVIRRTESSVPFRRIQQIDIVQGPIERWLDIATLAIRTAAATSDGTIPGIPLEDAEGVRAKLLTRAGRDDAV